MTFIKPELHELRNAFRRHGHEIRLVGGAVRCWLLGETPADFDLATDATPEEQQAIYVAEKIKHFPTGIRHGTWTAKLADETVVEITSLRTETSHDGRHAVMTWTRDWHLDLARRDLTINAIAMSFDGEIVDPFGGQVDLKNRVVRFVGDAELRISEDYLRILRFFRFHAKIAGARAYDPVTIAAITANMVGLDFISRERVWSEISKIISGRYGIKTLYDIIDLGIARHIDLPVADRRLPADDEFQVTRDAASLMAAYLGRTDAVETQADAWRWSVMERQQAAFLIEVLGRELSLRQAQTLVVRGAIKYWVSEGLRLHGKVAEADALLGWTVPEFPITGGDLLRHGLEGPEIGTTLRALQFLWDESDYVLTKAQLMGMVRQHWEHDK